MERAIEEDEPFLESDLGIKVELDTEHTLPMQWGFTVRFRDYADLLRLQPRLLEFHFTDQDLDDAYPGDDLDLQLVVHAPEFWERTLVDLCALDEKQRLDSIALMQRSIDLTRQMAPHFKQVTPKVIIHPGAASLDHPIEDRERLYANLEDSLGRIDAEGVELLLENLPPHPWYFGGQWLTNAFMDAHEIRDFLVPRGLKMCFDTSHLKLYCNWSHTDFYEQAAILLPLASHLHLADGSGLDGEGLQIGEGNIDWVHFFRVSKDYHGTMIPEIWRGHQYGGQGFVLAIQRLTAAYHQATEGK